MRPESRKLLVDMLGAATDISVFMTAKSSADYATDKQLRYSVERGFEIVGEALSQLSKLDPDLATQISQRRKIISFRNVLIHGYSQISHAITWEICQRDLPVLKSELETLLS